MQNKNRSNFIAVARLVQWGGDIRSVPQDIREAFAKYVLENLGHPDFDVTELRSLVASGQPIQAIKLYRELVPGTGLKEAKDFVDKLKEEVSRN